MQRLLLLTPSLIAILVVAVWASPAAACPFCTPVSRTLSEEIDSMDVAVLGRLVNATPAATNRDVPQAVFEITAIVKGNSHLAGIKAIETPYLGTAKIGDRFLLLGVDPPKIAWSMPLRISERAVDYIQRLHDLPATAERLAYFQDFLEDQDDVLARDAYDEFAKAPYKDVIGLRDKMNRDHLVAWIKNPAAPTSRRRLYLVMLSICGGPADLPLLETMLRSDERKLEASLDAMIGCYLLLAGAEGLPLIEELYLKNPKAAYADTYAAVAALRFHGTETDVIPRARLLEGLRHILNRPPLADLVIPDLARWEDWSQLERLVRLFRDADDKSNRVRVPVVNYLRACPLPEAKERLKELNELDPDAVKRANAFFPFGSGGPAPKPR
jgi:hypothetical protein